MSEPTRNFRQEITAYIVQMQSLAAIGALKGTSSHPLFRSLATLEQMLNAFVTPAGELKLEKLGPEPQVIVNQLLQVLSAQSAYGYDRMYWLADNYFEELIQDDETRQFIQSRLPIPEHYEATIAELAYWGWLKARGLFPQLTEDSGKPDLKVGEDTSGDEVHCDVKAILPGTKASRIDKIVKKANKQIKNVAGENTKGFCFIRIIEPITRFPDISDTGRGYLWLKPDEGSRNANGVPNEIAAYFDRAQHIMASTTCRSVSKVILSWEERLVIGNIPGWMTVLGNRKSCEIEHANARQPFHIDADLLPKATIAFNINLKPRVTVPNFPRFY